MSPLRLTGSARRGGRRWGCHAGAALSRVQEAHPAVTYHGIEGRAVSLGLVHKSLFVLTAMNLHQFDVHSSDPKMSTPLVSSPASLLTYGSGFALVLTHAGSLCIPDEEVAWGLVAWVLKRWQGGRVVGSTLPEGTSLGKLDDRVLVVVSTDQCKVATYSAAFVRRWLQRPVVTHPRVVLGLLFRSCLATLSARGASVGSEPTSRRRCRPWRQRGRDQRRVLPPPQRTPRHHCRPPWCWSRMGLACRAWMARS